MLRPLFALLLFTLPVLAAPVPKSVKPKSSVPSLAGTRWVGVNSVADLGTIEYEFKDGGDLSYAKHNGQTRTNGTWKQDGDTLTWSVNNGYANYTLTYKDGAFEGSATNVKGVTWQIKLSPVEKK